MTITSPPVSSALLHYGRLVPIRPETKTPWLRSVIKSASNDPAVMAKWRRNKPGCGWGLRIESDELVVLDLEVPGKGSACGGQRTLDWIQLENGKRLPDTWVISTRSGGEHRYYRLPAEYRGRMRNWTQALPGIDVRVTGGIVMLPPSDGYTWLEGPDPEDGGQELAEIPEWFLEELLEGRDQEPNPPKKTKPRTRTISKHARPVLMVPVSKREWCRLFRARGFATTWNRTRHMPNDDSQSAWEYSLAQRGYRAGLSTPKVVNLVAAWWGHHGLQGDVERLVNRILPDAWYAVKDYVERWRAEQEAAVARKAAGKTTNRILALLAGGPATPAQIAQDLQLSREVVKKACQRMAAQGRLSAMNGAYMRVTTTATEIVDIPEMSPAGISAVLAPIDAVGAAMVQPGATESPDSTDNPYTAVPVDTPKMSPAPDGVQTVAPAPVTAAA